MASPGFFYLKGLTWLIKKVSFVLLRFLRFCLLRLNDGMNERMYFLILAGHCAIS